MNDHPSDIKLMRNAIQSPESKSYSCTITLQGHTDWVRDVAWSPTVLQKSYIASASQDKTVRIWTCVPSSSSSSSTANPAAASLSTNDSTHHDHQQQNNTTDGGAASGGGNKGGGKSEEWHSTTLNFEAVLWRVSWSLSGNVLAVSGGDNKVSLWKENLRGEWECVKTIEE